MNNGGEAADQMVREALQFSEVAIKLTALGFKNSLAIALAYAKENPKVRGKTSLDRLLREGKEMKIIPLQTKDLAQFKAYAKQYGVLFASIKDKSAQGEKIDIMFKAEDVSKLNRIYWYFVGQLWHGSFGKSVQFTDCFCAGDRSQLHKPQHIRYFAVVNRRI